MTRRLNRTGDSGAGSAVTRRGELDEHAVAGARVQEGDAPGQPLARRLVEQRHVPLAGARRDPRSTPGVRKQRWCRPSPRLARNRATPESALVGSSSSISLSPAASSAARTPWSAISASRTSGQAQGVAPEAVRLAEILHDDADVMDVGDHVRRHTLADEAGIFKGFRARAEVGRAPLSRR